MLKLDTCTFLIATDGERVVYLVNARQRHACLLPSTRCFYLFVVGFVNEVLTYLSQLQSRKKQMVYVNNVRQLHIDLLIVPVCNISVAETDRDWHCCYNTVNWVVWNLCLCCHTAAICRRQQFHTVYQCLNSLKGCCARLDDGSDWKSRPPPLVTFVCKVSANLHYTDTGYGHVVQHHERTPRTVRLTTIIQLVVQQIHHQRTKICHIAMPEPNISTCQDVVMCPLVVEHVRSRCPRSGVWHLTLPPI